MLICVDKIQQKRCLTAVVTVKKWVKVTSHCRIS